MLYSPKQTLGHSLSAVKSSFHSQRYNALHQVRDWQWLIKSGLEYCIQWVSIVNCKSNAVGTYAGRVSNNSGMWDASAQGRSRTTRPVQIDCDPFYRFSDQSSCQCAKCRSKMVKVVSALILSSSGTMFGDCKPPSASLYRLRELSRGRTEDALQCYLQACGHV